MKNLTATAAAALELANRYRLAAVTYRAIGALVLATACETLAAEELKVVEVEEQREGRDDGAG